MNKILVQHTTLCRKFQHRRVRPHCERFICCVISSFCNLSKFVPCFLPESRRWLAWSYGTKLPIFFKPNRFE